MEYRGPTNHPAVSAGRLLAPALALLLLTAGCGHRLSAAHLSRQAWAESGALSLQGKFLRFAFQARAQDGAYRVWGQASPVQEHLPAWADRVNSLTVLAYLCDASGDVLAHQSRQYPAQKVPAGGFPFDFTLVPPAPVSGDLYVSFGYSAVFAPPGAPQAASGQTFFASEQAALAR